MADLQPGGGESAFSPLDSERVCDYDNSELHDFRGYAQKGDTPQQQ